LRYHHKLVASLAIVFGIILLLLAVAQDQVTLKVHSAYGASDPRFAGYVTALLGVETTSGNQYDVLTNGDEFFPAMLAAIRQARRRISFETYIYEKGHVAEAFTSALEAAARTGVQVDLVVDTFGANSMPDEAIDRLQRAGARIGRFGKLKWYSLENLNYRAHRKILVVDGKIAFTGGAGVSDHWIGNAQDPDHWRDTMVRITGPLARMMEGAFDENLMETVAPVTPIVDPLPEPPTPTVRDAGFILRSASSGGSNDLKRFYLLAIASATRTLDICTPYFILDESSEWSLDQAAARGVRIRVLVEGDHTDARPVKYASRQAYETLMGRGIEIYEYAPTMMHTKAMIVDGVFSMFGSANLDNRSLELNDEMNVGIIDPDLAASFEQDFEADLRSANRLDRAGWQRRSLLEKGREYFWSYFGEVF
jgi:cardiolipin synthase